MPRHETEVSILQFRPRTPAGQGFPAQTIGQQVKILRAAYFQGLWRQLLAWYQAREAVAHLRSLDDAALKDIGLHRSGIEAAVAQEPSKPLLRSGQAFHEKPHLILQRTG